MFTVKNVILTTGCQQLNSEQHKPIKQTFLNMQSRVLTQQNTVNNDVCTKKNHETNKVWTHVKKGHQHQATPPPVT